MASSIEKLQYHLVFCTKYRYKLITENMANILKMYFQKKQDIWEYTLKSLAVEKDHVHILFEIKNSQVGLNKLIARLKGGSSFLLRKQFKALLSYPSLWTPSHFCASVGDVSGNTIAKYIQNQGIEEKEEITRTFIYKIFDPNPKKKKQLNAWLSSFSSRPKGLQCGYQKNFPTLICLRNDLIQVKKVKKKKFSYALRLPGGNNWKQCWLCLQGQDLPEEYKLCDSQIIKDKKGIFWVHLVIKEERTIQNQILNNKFLALDLGIMHPITGACVINGKMTGSFFMGDEVKREKYLREQRQAKLQKHSKENILQRLLCHTRRIKDYVHQYTTKIVKIALEKQAVITVGNLRGITKTWDKKQKRRNKGFRKKAKSMPYGRIMQQLFYKATLAGVQCVFVDEAYTSKRCSRCRVIGSRTGDRFVCKICKYKNQADINGAINIATVCQQGYNDMPYMAKASA